MSSAKEPNFFIEAGNFGKGLDWYRSMFADHTKICGEASHQLQQEAPAPGRAGTAPSARSAMSG